MLGRTIKIHLVRGTPNDVTTAEINASWTGKIVLAPRARIAELAQRPEVQRSGVYILVGDDPNSPSKEQVYVGESDNTLTRLKQHISDPNKIFWERTIIIVSKDEHLTKSLVKYLESRLIEIIGQARRATLTNDKTPPLPPLPESDIADMEYFLAQVQMLLPVLGFTFILPAPEVQGLQAASATTPAVTPQLTDSPEFTMSVTTAAARAREINGEFVVLKGSTANDENPAALSQSNIQLRKQLVEDKKLLQDNATGLWVFTENVPFRSTSAAASVVAGSNKNGLITWFVAGAKLTYGGWQSAKIIDSSAASIDGTGVNGDNSD